MLHALRDGMVENTMQYGIMGVSKILKTVKGYDDAANLLRLA